MNKMISMIAAAALAVSCFSCSDDKKKKEEPKPTDTAVNEDTGDTLVTEPVYREYSEDDFKTIDVSLSYPDREPPVNVSSVDLSGLDFGSKVPVCNKAENVESYYTNDYYVPVDTGQDWSSYKDKAEKGCAANCYMYGGKYYIVAVYRAAFVGNYDFSLFQYDESSGKNEEIYSWSSNDINERYMQTPVLANGKMLYSVYNETDKISKVYAYDLDSGDVKIIYENSSPDEFIYVSRDNMGFPSMIVYDTDFYVIETLFYEEDSESFISDKTDDLGGRVVSQNIINGAPFYLVRPEDSQMLDMVSDHYRVSLSYIGGDIVYGDDKMFIVKNYTLIHIYDMEKMEHYILDVEDMGDEAVYSKGFVFLSSKFRDYDSPVYCIKPDMGIVYPIVDVFECNGIESFDDKVMFNTLKNQTNDADTETGGISYSVEKVYTVTVK